MYPKFNANWSILGSDSHPVISNVTVARVNGTSVQIAWKTDKPTTSKVNYGTTLSYGGDVQSQDLVKNHVVTLENLQKDQNYFFEVMGQIGNKYTYDAYYSFRTDK